MDFDGSFRRNLGGPSISTSGAVTDDDELNEPTTDVRMSGCQLVRLPRWQGLWWLGCFFPEKKLLTKKHGEHLSFPGRTLQVKKHEYESFKITSRCMKNLPWQRPKVPISTTKKNMDSQKKSTLHETNIALQKMML